MKTDQKFFEDWSRDLVKDRDDLRAELAETKAQLMGARFEADFAKEQYATVRVERDELKAALATAERRLRGLDDIRDTLSEVCSERGAALARVKELEQTRTDMLSRARRAEARAQEAEERNDLLEENNHLLLSRAQSARESALEEAARVVEALEQSPAALAIANGQRSRGLFIAAARSIRALKHPEREESAQIDAKIPERDAAPSDWCSHPEPYAKASDDPGDEYCRRCGKHNPRAAPLKGDEE